MLVLSCLLSSAFGALAVIAWQELRAKPKTVIRHEPIAVHPDEKFFAARVLSVVRDAENRMVLRR